MDALLKYLESMPSYIMNLIAFFSYPKTFLKHKNTGAEQDWTNALAFFSLSTVMVFLIQASTALDKTTLLVLLKAMASWLVGIFIIAVAIKLSWRIVGGRATFNSILLTQLYVYSGFIIILAFMNLILAGIIAVFYPDYYAELMKFAGKGLAHMLNQQISNPRTFSPIFQEHPSLLRFSTAFAFIFDLVFLYWCIAIWGAYRELNSASRARSVAAFIICGFISVPTLGVMLMLTAGGSLTTAPH